MTLPRTAADVLREHVVFELECIDRIYCNLYVPKLQRELGVVGFIKEHLGKPVVSAAVLAERTEAFYADVRRFAAARGVEIVEFAAGQRKDEVMRERLAAFAAAGRTEGVVFIGRAQEKVKVFATTRRRDADGNAYPWIVRENRVVTQWYFYCYDASAGPFFLKYCGYFPYNAKLCANGNEYAKAMAARAGIAFTPLDNGFAAVSDVAEVQVICDSFDEKVIWDLAAKWTALLPCPFTAADAAAGYRYDISVLQAEFSLTQVLDKPVTGRIFFEQVIRDNLDIGRPDQAGLIFGRRIIRTGPRATPGTFRTRVITDGVIPTLHVDYKHSKIKQYHKEGKALRTETTINNPRDFGIGKRLHNLPALRAAGFTATRRLLDVQKLSCNPADGHAAIRQICDPLTTPAGTRVAGLRLGGPPRPCPAGRAVRVPAPSPRLRQPRPAPHPGAAPRRDRRVHHPGEDDLRPAPPALPRPHRAHPRHLPLPGHRNRPGPRAVPDPPARPVPAHRHGQARRAGPQPPQPGSRHPRLHRRTGRPRQIRRPHRLTSPVTSARYPDPKASELDSRLKINVIQACYAPSGTSPGRSGPSGSSADGPR
jgi:hypothetical protein